MVDARIRSHKSRSPEVGIRSLLCLSSADASYPEAHKGHAHLARIAAESGRERAGYFGHTQTEHIQTPTKRIGGHGPRVRRWTGRHLARSKDAIVHLHRQDG